MMPAFPVKQLHELIESKCVVEAFASYYTCSDAADNVLWNIAEALPKLDMKQQLTKDIAKLVEFGVDYCTVTQRKLSNLETAYEYIQPEVSRLLDLYYNSEQEVNETKEKCADMERKCKQLEEKINQIKRGHNEEKTEMPRKSEAFTIEFDNIRKYETVNMPNQKALSTGAIAPKVTPPKPERCFQTNDDSIYYSTKMVKNEMTLIQQSFDDSVSNMEQLPHYNLDDTLDSCGRDEPRLIDDSPSDKKVGRIRRSRSRGLATAKKAAKIIIRRSRSLSLAFKTKRHLKYLPNVEV